MSRVAIQILVPLLLPIVLYLVWAKYAAWRAQVAGAEPQPLSEGPWTWLIVGGLALSITGLIGMALLQESLPEGQYVPQRFEDGVIKPAEVLEKCDDEGYRVPVTGRGREGTHRGPVE